MRDSTPTDPLFGSVGTLVAGAESEDLLGRNEGALLGQAHRATQSSHVMHTLD